jgi:hypothetical protein
LNQLGKGKEGEALRFAIKARILLAALGNLDDVLHGHGDFEFAWKRLELAAHFLPLVQG